MKIHELTVSAAKRSKRVGRGIGSGRGKTAGRGTKGQNSRSGGGTRPGFEGGQNPLAKRLPKKRGFQALNRTIYQTIKLSQLEGLQASAKVTNEQLAAAGLIRSAAKPVKILGTGNLTKKLTVQTQAATAGAKAAITKAGGSFEAAVLPKTPKKPSARNRKAQA